jgi:hypothetical protein
MESDDIYKYIGFFVLVFFLIYIVLRTMKFHFKIVNGFRNTMEGFTSTDKDKVSDAIKSNTNKVSDSLLITKYLKAYEDTILELDTNINVYILSQVLQNAESISADPGSDASQKIITKINNTKMFIDSLNHSIKVLDKK